MDASINPTSYVAEILDGHSRKVVKTFGFQADCLKGRTPIEAAWDIAKIFIVGTPRIHVRLK